MRGRAGIETLSEFRLEILHFDGGFQHKCLYRDLYIVHLETAILNERCGLPARVYCVSISILSRALILLFTKVNQ